MSLSDINPQIDPGSDVGNKTIISSSHPSQPQSTQSNIQANAAAVKDTVVNSESLTSTYLTTPSDASAAVNAIKDHPVTQNVVNGPVAQSVKAEAAQTSDEFGGLVNSRQTPAHKAANGQSLTNYHSFFYTLLSWRHPRATGITFAASIAFIFACRYLPVLKWALKMSWMVLGVVTLAEVAAKFVMGSSVASSVRPRRYYKIPKESLEASLEDLEQLINFFVIEVQRIIFAENIPATALAFSSAFISYYLIKILPFWGLSLVFTSVLYLAPLIYIQNKELIDGQLEHASNVIGQQTAQVKELTVEHTSKGLESIKQYTNEYSSKASELIGNARQQIPIPGNTATTTSSTRTSNVGESDFPSAPKTTLPSAASHTTPVVHAPVEGEPIAVSN